MHSEETAINPAAEKVIRLVEFLTRLASLRTKIVRDVADHDEVLWMSSIPRERGCFAQPWGRSEEHDLDEWLEVRSRPEPGLPKVPEACRDWVNPEALRDKSKLPELPIETTLEVPNPDWMEGNEEPGTIQKTVRLDDYPEVQEAWRGYVESDWRPWTEKHTAWEKLYRVYSTLFSIHQAQLRLGEEYELVVGLGLFTWLTPTNQRVRRHFVVADAILEFEAHLGKFTVKPHPDGAKLRPELDMLEIETQPAGAEEAAKSSIADAADDPWDKVSAILNLSDGMLSDFLQLHVICTINCTAADIDQALLRPGRLVSHRVFKRLDIPQATALATSLGKTLAPAQDYSLAEVFADGQPEHVARPQIGFSACSVNLPAALEGKESSSTPDILGGT